MEIPGLRTHNINMPGEERKAITTTMIMMMMIIIIMSPVVLDRPGSASSDSLFKDFQFVFILPVSNSALFLALFCKGAKKCSQ
jgi:hypothetical protein